MTVFRLTPAQGAPVLRCAATLARATERGLREFPVGLRSVELLGLPHLAALAAEGWPLPAAARQCLEVYKAVQRERTRATSKAQAIREKARQKAAAERNAKRTQEQAEREAWKAAAKATRAAEKRRQQASARRAKRQAEEEAQAIPPAPSLTIDTNDTRLPWED